MTRTMIAILLVLSAGLAACNTIAGAGQDLSSGGQAISNAADKAK
ncbi:MULTISPECIES: entericidin A/B family lipoprotein [Paraburkholderia]|nr:MULTISPECIES: entericidin A/B family lipoprotein [Paraburkholderia]MCX4161442.1 entericidin A/B family lipoprotein [Paraburkholderia megapolitana]MDN7156938.1 entericidin A/B family lipoprotein [Paraburkholderia sp. CHISQ3]MDQ6493983.1 entericidin A/B family lipoprotein [Paraburkholderia megapolitana]